MKPERTMPTRLWALHLTVTLLVFVSLLMAPLAAQAQTPPGDEPPTDTPNQITNLTEDAPAWSLSYTLTPPTDQPDAEVNAQAERAQLEDMLLSKQLDQRGVAYQVNQAASDVFQVDMQGQSTLDDLRALLYGELTPELDFLGGVIVLEISGISIDVRELPVLLESRPATGYRWSLDTAASTLVQETADQLNSPRAETAGAPALTQLNLQTLAQGASVIRLVYARPWLADQQPTRVLRVQFSNLPERIDLSSPIPVTQNPAPVLDAPAIVEPMAALPSSFDWRAQGKVTPVRDQGSCGSCWAFGTVGAMESAMVVQGGVSADLSEQFLVSCNNDGDDCNGGWWAHDYHVSRKGKNQTDAGAVLESAKPYTATNGTCTVAYNHPYKAMDWGYVSGSLSTMPSTEQIKNAIYTYGSVAASVCSGSAWNGYRGGVFATEERSQCGGSGQVNHAVLLVGWNDSNQTWILKNSWGTWWGDNGYMYIKYGTSKVGYGATYVRYSNTTPPTPEPTPPPAAPGNDAIAAATTIPHSGGPVDYRSEINTAGATNETSDPTFPFTSNPRKGANTVWYRFTPVSTGTLTVDTSGSAYDTILGVWSGQPGALQMVKWNDNNGSSKQSKVSFTTGKGVPYYIEVAASSIGGSMKLHLVYAASSVSNNSISYAVTVPYAGDAQTTNYSTVLDVSRATVSSSDPAFPDGRGKGNRTVWFKFTPKVNGTLSVSTAGSNYANLIGVWRKPSSFNLVGFGDSGSVQAPLVGGLLYYIEVASVPSSGPSALNLAVTFTPSAVVGSGLYDNANSAIYHLGEWQAVGALATSSTIYDTVGLTFSGQRVTVQFTRQPNAGTVSIYIDGKSAASLNQKSSTTLERVQWTSAALSAGSHTIRLVHSKGGLVNYDSIQVHPATAAAVASLLDDARPDMIAYRGTWQAQAGVSGPRDGTQTRSLISGQKATMTFTGTGVSVGYAKLSGGGSLKVYVDGKLLGTLSQSASTPAYQQVWTSKALTSAQHTLTLLHYSGSHVNVDWIEVK